MIRFLLDEHVPHAVAHGLHLRGVEVLTLVDADHLGATDEAIIEFAVQESLVIYTQDDDFLAMAAEDDSHAGIVYCKQQTRSLGQVVQFLKLMSECLDPEDMADQVEYL